MTAPKRLWSGDWQKDSEALSEELANRRANPPHAEPTAPPPRVHTKRPEGVGTRGVVVADGTRRLRAAVRSASKRLAALALRASPRLKKVVSIALAALLILAAGAYALGAALGSSGQSASPAVGVPSRPAYWLGMQIESVPPGEVVVDTVAAGSPAELAGLDPGDVIAEVSGRPLNATGDIKQAIGGLRRGDQVEIQASRGSTMFTTHARLAAPPSGQP